ncbi:DUF3857 domain-containing transglutaminase family protein [Solimicrobium silvestre]|uniref:DUF3857 domain-containing protein n=1 Tax=Solimicrobium silvestre TaxID=2099400 RepID=A0A2S9GT04_9BURK|nr:DUF3857 domain-containing protein [Solimicrobium silvestre]PRC90826.1 hypothetical protein S2091_4489 [Solimicrobium silvestre]
MRKLPDILRLIGCFLLFSVATTNAATREYQIGPAPEWVIPVSFNTSTNRENNDNDSSLIYLLSDQQTRVEHVGKTTYFHYAKKATASNGLEKIASINIVFDPSYQNLVLNVVNIIRNGQVIKKTDSVAIHVLQRETELDYLIYDGSKTVNVVVDDVRVGDIVEYAYSLSGMNPVFQNKASGGGDLQWAVPIERVFFRLMVPTDRHFTIKSHESKLQSVMTERNGYRDYQWDVANMPGLKLESDTPSWYEPYGSIQWSEFPDWLAVQQWAKPLYRTPDVLPAELSKEVSHIKQTATSQGDRMLAALHFVQREIRYLGIEVGPGSHAPNAPALVMQRRFGDCKDKTLLTLTLLKALGIEAYPALVNTTMGPSLTDWSPTPNLFNHVLVRAKVDGNIYWIDPTRSLQQGDLAHLYQPDYGHALVLDNVSNKLTVMNSSVSTKKIVNAEFDSTAGLDKPVKLVVTTTDYGKHADELRNNINSHSKNELEKNYLNYYARYYPTIKSTDSIEFREDIANNTVTTIESYTIPNFWVLQENKIKRDATIHIPDVRLFLTAPKDINRTAPIRVSFPEDVSVTTELKLPSKWNIDDSQSNIDDPAFEYSNKTWMSDNGRRLHLSDQYRALTDHVDAQDIPAYAANLNKAYDSVGFTLNYSGTNTPVKKAHFSHNDWKYLIIILMLIIWSWMIMLQQTSPPENRLSDRSLVSCTVVASGSFIPFLLSSDVHWLLLLGALGICTALIMLAKAVNSAPQSHWLSRYAGGYTQTVHSTFSARLLPILKKIPAVIGWITIGVVIYRGVVG